MTLEFDPLDDENCQCCAAGIGGVIVPEVLEIEEVCQDPDNLNIIYILASIIGVYAYSPRLTLHWEGQSVNATSAYIPDYKGMSPTGPIEPQCGALTVLLAYNTGILIPNFETLSELTVELQFMGNNSNLGFSDLILSSGIFESTNPSATARLVKGVTPKPYKLYYDPNTGALRLQYSNMGDKPCMCAIDCVNPDEDDYNLTVCEDEIQEVTVESTSIVGDPTNVKIVFMDATGNKTVIRVHAMTNVQPLSPSVMKHSGPDRIEVALYYATVHTTVVNKHKVAYQVWKYENNTDSAYVWKDWSSGEMGTFYDTDCRDGVRYGYSVRFRGEFGETSSLAEWAFVDF